MSAHPNDLMEITQPEAEALLRSSGTVLIPTGSTGEILVDVTNPGTWMMHCHIAEHLHAGMMFPFTVEEGDSR